MSALSSTSISPPGERGEAALPLFLEAALKASLKAAFCAARLRYSGAGGIFVPARPLPPREIAPPSDCPGARTAGRLSGEMSHRA